MASHPLSPDLLKNHGGEHDLLQTYPSSAQNQISPPPLTLDGSADVLPLHAPPITLDSSAVVIDAVTAGSSPRAISLSITDETSKVKSQVPFVPSLGAWGKPLKISMNMKDPITICALSSETPISMGKLQSPSDILPPEVKKDGQLRFPWAAKMDPKIRNLYRTTSPTYLEDGTPMVEIPNHVLLQGLENQKEYVVGQFVRCNTPSGGLVHAMANRIWGKKCKIFTRKLGDSSFLFHIPDVSTRAWVLERGLWHIDDCIMFVAPWTSTTSLALPEITSFPLWVTLKNIPSCLYSEWGISWIASGLGEPMLTNKPRLDPTLMGEAKLMVEVELDKPFPQKIAATDKIGNVSMVDVEYSWLPKKCEKCGHLGHKESRCLLHLQPRATAHPAANTLSSTISIATQVAQHVDNDLVSVLPTITSSSPLSEIEQPPTVLSPQTKPISPLTNLASRKATPAQTTLEGIPSTRDTLFTSPNSGSSANEVVKGNVFGSNQFASLDFGVYKDFEMGDSSQMTRVGRTIKPTQKVQEQWITIRGRGKRGRGGHVGHG